MWPGEQAALATLKSVLPEVDFAVVSEVLDHRLHGEYLSDPVQLADLLRRSLTMIEAVYWKLIESGQRSDGNEA